MRATTRSAEASTNSMPSRARSGPPCSAMAPSMAADTSRVATSSGAGRDQDQLRAQTQEKSREDPPHGHVPPPEPAADVQQLRRDVDDGSGGHRQKRDEDVGACDRVSEDGPHEGGAAPDDSGQRQISPRGSDVLGRQRADDAEP